MKYGTFILDDSELDIPALSSICGRCLHYPLGTGERVCKAFPDGIPMAIWMGKNDHTMPFEGDHGIRFDRINRPK